MGGNKEDKAKKNWTERFITFVQENKLLLILEAVFIAFHKFFEGIVNDYLLVFYKDFESTNHTIVIFWIIVFFILADMVIKIYHRYKYSFSSIFHLLFVLVVYYCYYRIEQDIWFFKPLYQDVPIYYLDLIPIYIFTRFIIYFVSWKKRYKENGAIGFLIDQPINEIDEDNLGRNGFANKIATKLIATESKKSSFAVGINGGWGSGKTSFLKLIEEQLTETNNIIIHFTPWLNQGKESIIRDFFSVFNEKIKKYINITSPLKEYVDLLKEDSGGYFGKYIGMVEGVFFPKKNVKAQYDEINEKIKKLNKKIYIFIDDIDRLSKEEVVEVIKLIRNTANFSNTFFIVAYDKSYVIEAIKSYNDYEPDRFLEKIFQVEFSLPMYEESIIKEVLFDTLIKGVQREDAIILKEMKNENFPEKEINYKHYFSTLRDISRFINSFLTIYDSFQKEEEFTICIRDLLFLEILRTKFPKRYELLFSIKKYITKEEGDYGHNRYVFDQRAFIQPKQAGADTISGSYKNHEILLVKNLIKIIFPNKPSDMSCEYSISFQKNFNRYSYFRLTDIDIEKFKYNRINKGRQLREWVDEQIKKGRVNELIIQHINSYKPKNYLELWRMLISSFYLARALQKNKEIFVDEYVRTIHTILYQDKPYLGEKAKVEYKKLLEYLFNIAKPPFLFEAKLLFEITSKRTDNILSNETIEEVKKLYITRYIEKIEKPNDALLELLDYCCTIPNVNNYIENGSMGWNWDIFELGYNFILKNGLGWFLKEKAFYLFKEVNGIKDYSINDRILYKEFLNRLFEGNIESDNACINEYKSLYEQLKRKNFIPSNWMFENRNCEPSHAPDSHDQGIS